MNLNWEDNGGNMNQGAAYVFRDLFTEASEVAVTSHTPDVGAYVANKRLNNVTVESSAPNTRVSTSGGMFSTIGSNIMGPLVDVGKTACEATYVVKTANGSSAFPRYMLRIDPATNARGPIVSVSTVEIRLYTPALATDVVWTGTVTAGDIIKVVDDGTQNASWCKVYQNGTLRITSTVANTSNTLTHHATSPIFSGTGSAIGPWEII